MRLTVYVDDMTASIGAYSHLFPPAVLVQTMPLIPAQCRPIAHSLKLGCIHGIVGIAIRSREISRIFQLRKMLSSRTQAEFGHKQPLESSVFGKFKFLSEE